MERTGGRRKPIAHRVVFTAGLMALAGAVPARRSVKLAGASFALVVALVSALWLAPFAEAIPAVCPDDNPACQSDIPGVPDNPDTGGPGDVVPDPTEPVDPVTDPIEDTTDPVTDPIEDETDPVTDPIEDVTDPVTDPIEDVTDPVTDPIEDTTGPILEDDEGLDVPDLGRILKPEPPTFEPPTEPINGGLKDVRKAVEKIDSTESFTGPIDSGSKKFERVQSVVGKEQPKDDGRRTKDKTPGGGDATSPAIAGFPEARSSLGGALADHRPGLDANLAADSEGTTPSLFDRVGDVSVEVAKKLAFPLALLLLVAGFLLIHNRIDRKDPKLAHAPVSADNDSLSFD